MQQSKKEPPKNIQEITSRIFELNMELATMSYSQSNPGAMIYRRNLRRELEHLEEEFTNLITKKSE